MVDSKTPLRISKNSRKMQKQKLRRVHNEIGYLHGNDVKPVSHYRMFPRLRKSTKLLEWDRSQQLLRHAAPTYDISQLNGLGAANGTYWHTAPAAVAHFTQSSYDKNFYIAAGRTLQARPRNDAFSRGLPGWHGFYQRHELAARLQAKIDQLAMAHEASGRSPLANRCARRLNRYYTPLGSDNNNKSSNNSADQHTSDFNRHFTGAVAPGAQSQTSTPLDQQDSSSNHSRSTDSTQCSANERAAAQRHGAAMMSLEEARRRQSSSYNVTADVGGVVEASSDEEIGPGHFAKPLAIYPHRDAAMAVESPRESAVVGGDRIKSRQRHQQLLQELNALSHAGALRHAPHSNNNAANGSPMQTAPLVDGPSAGPGSHSGSGPSYRGSSAASGVDNSTGVNGPADCALPYGTGTATGAMQVPVLYKKLSEEATVFRPDARKALAMQGYCANSYLGWHATKKTAAAHGQSSLLQPPSAALSYGAPPRPSTNSSSDVAQQQAPLHVHAGQHNRSADTPGKNELYSSSGTPNGSRTSALSSALGGGNGASGAPVPAWPLGSSSGADSYHASTSAVMNGSVMMGNKNWLLAGLPPQPPVPPGGGSSGCMQSVTHNGWKLAVLALVVVIVSGVLVAMVVALVSQVEAHPSDNGGALVKLVRQYAGEMQIVDGPLLDLRRDLLDRRSSIFRARAEILENMLDSVFESSEMADVYEGSEVTEFRFIIERPALEVRFNVKTSLEVQLPAQAVLRSLHAGLKDHFVGAAKVDPGTILIENQRYEPTDFDGLHTTMDGDIIMMQQKMDRGVASAIQITVTPAPAVFRHPG